MADAQSEDAGFRLIRRQLPVRRPLPQGAFLRTLPESMAQLILFNKPYGVVCQFSPPGSGRGLRPDGADSGNADGTAARTLRDYLPQRDIYPAGRLDADSEGLVVLTADGALQHHIADPSHKLPKTYYVEVEGVPTAAALHKMRSGIDLGDFRTLPAQARIVAPPDWLWPRVPPVRFRKRIPTAWLEITLKEGKNRQVRRMTAAAGFPTLRLIRHRIGEWTIAGLNPGEWRALSVNLPNAGRPGSGERGKRKQSPKSTANRPRR